MVLALQQQAAIQDQILYLAPSLLLVVVLVEATQRTRVEALAGPAAVAFGAAAVVERATLLLRHLHKVIAGVPAQLRAQSTAAAVVVGLLLSEPQELEAPGVMEGQALLLQSLAHR